MYRFEPIFSSQLSKTDQASWRSTQRTSNLSHGRASGLGRDCADRSRLDDGQGAGLGHWPLAGPPASAHHRSRRERSLSTDRKTAPEQWGKRSENKKQKQNSRNVKI